MSRPTTVDFVIVKYIKILQKANKVWLNTLLWPIMYVFILTYVYFVTVPKRNIFLKIVMCAAWQRGVHKMCQSYVGLSANQLPAFRNMLMASSVVDLNRPPNSNAICPRKLFQLLSYYTPNNALFLSNWIKNTVLPQTQGAFKMLGQMCLKNFLVRTFAQGLEISQWSASI